MKLDIQFFAEPDGTDAGSDLDALNAMLDSGSTEDNTADDSGTDDESGDGGTPPADTQKEKEKEQHDSRQNASFAKMRSELASTKALLKKIAGAAGIEAADDNDLVSKLSDDAIEKLAKKQNVPVELYKRLELLEQQNKIYLEQQREQNVGTAVNGLKETYKLTDEAVVDFFKELSGAGVDPFTQDIDLEATYLKLHLNDIIEARTKAAVESATKKMASSKQTSTTPPEKSGAPASAEEKISSVADLDNFLKALK